jgi:hypothetical protein
MIYTIKIISIENIYSRQTLVRIYVVEEYQERCPKWMTRNLSMTSPGCPKIDDHHSNRHLFQSMGRSTSHYP